MYRPKLRGFYQGTEMAEKHLNKCSKSLASRKCKSRLLWDSFLYLSECLWSITQLTADGKSGEQGQLSSLAGELQI